MEFLDYRVILYFKSTPSSIILKKDDFYREYNPKLFSEIVRHDISEMTDSEANYAYDYLRNLREEYSDGNGLNVFDALSSVASKYLRIRDNLPVCRYDKILDWHNLVESVGEDLLVCAYLAQKSKQDGKEWCDFSWNPVIGHDNMQLNRIMQRGISDNHYHLFGSSPAFKLIWIRLMNDFEDEEYIEALEKMDHHHMSVEKRYSDSGEEESFVKMRFQAAIIRYYLNSYIRKMENGERVDDSETLGKIQKALKKEGNDYLYYGELEMSIEGKKLRSLLPDGTMVDDYACIDRQYDDINSEFAGERYLMYRMLKGYINGVKISDKLLNWFYVYLVIKIKFRQELVQVNQKVGFENFSYYSKRKNAFFNKETDVENMIKHAVGESFNTGNLKSLELRIAPQKTAVQNREFIEKCDNCIKEYLDQNKLNETYYVFHFSKQPDDKVNKKNTFKFMVCRHSKYREYLEEVSDEIIAFRELYPEQAKRVLGIDACANELICRPEVFGSAYRKLKQHIVRKEYQHIQRNVDKKESQYVQQLKMTYHVGEDWKDVADGLRAIDEAILFLNMSNGDRLGHATVLGIDIDDWYNKKNDEIWLTYQEYLDNIAWAYNKLIEFEIDDCEAIKGYLQSEFDQMYNKVFEGIPNIGELEQSINLYYESWKLRGDDPSVYITGEYVNPVIFKWYYINSELQEGSLIRTNKTVSKLMCLYHYSTQMRINGENIKHKKVNKMYIECMKKIQTAMQYKVSSKGICVETNPSSNFKISTLSKYEEHPITRFYNMGLTWNEELLDKCPQIHASINTDDKGLFDTSLENEYALVGCSMEKLSYNKQYVYDWLDRIRENGNQQSFKMN